MPRAMLVALAMLMWGGTVQAHPCDDPVPPTSATVTAGAIPLGWCHDGRDVNGNLTTFTGWVLYSNAVRTQLTVTTDGLANAAGLVFYQASVTFQQGNFTLSVAGLNTVGEAQPTPPFALSVSGPSGVPRAAVRFRVS